jgi:glycerol kinase
MTYRILIFSDSTGIQLSTYFSGIKLKWMIDHDPVVRMAHEADELLFGTVESWVIYVYINRLLRMYPLMSPDRSRTLSAE